MDVFLPRRENFSFLSLCSSVTSALLAILAEKEWKVSENGPRNGINQIEKLGTGISMNIKLNQTAYEVPNQNELTI